MSRSLALGNALATGTIDIEIVDRAEVECYPHWRRAFAAQRKDHRYYALLDETLDQSFDYRYFVIKDANGEVLAIQPFFLLDQNMLAGVSCQSASNRGSDSVLMILDARVGCCLRRISTMESDLRLSSLIPAGLIVESIVEREGSIAVTARAGTQARECPLCGRASSRVHSRYVRTVSDLPCAGRKVELCLVVRRFVCDAPFCGRRIFAERFEGVVCERSRRTARLECIVHHLGLALGGRPAASFAKRLMMPVSNDTLLRVVRRRACSQAEPLRVAGIDDWAFRRNHRYGTIVCDLERRRIVTLLPDREIATIEAWLAGQPGIEVISRDRGGGYGEAAAKALPHAIQVADRWHLMENASTAFLDAVRKSMRSIREAIGAMTITPGLLTCAEKLQYEGYLRREETNAAIIKLASAGIPIKEIVRRTGHSRKLVRQVIRGERTDVFRVRQSSLEAYLPFLEEQWSLGCRSGAELWRRLKARRCRVRSFAEIPALWICSIILRDGSDRSFCDSKTSQ